MSSQKVVDQSELPLNLEDLPNFKLKDNPFSDILLSQNNHIETAAKFIKYLQNLLISKQVDQKCEDELYNLYDVAFNKVSDLVFKNDQWPQPNEIEEHDENLEINITTQLLYSELCYRHVFARLQNISIEIRQQSWENYLEIFDTILLDKEDVPLPIQWIWDIIDEFLYQFQTNCQWRAKLKETDADYQHIQGIHEFWNFQQTYEVLTKLIEKSNIFNKSKSDLNLLDRCKTLQYFGYFSLVGQMRLNIMQGNYNEALNCVQCIHYTHLPIYSKAYACYLSLFYYAGFAFLMIGRHRETVKIFETLLSFIGKYKQFYSKSFQFGAMNKQADKTLQLLALALIFYPTIVEETVQKMLDEKLSEKMLKLQTYDISTFNDVFTKGCPKFTGLIKDFAHFKKMETETNASLLTHEQRDLLAKDFIKIQNLNNISSVLRLYKQISLQKAAVIFKMSTEELKKLLTEYKQRASSQLKNTPFESTIISKFAGGLGQLDFSLNNDNVISVNEVTHDVNYTNQFINYNKKIDEMVLELEVADANYIAGL